MGDLWFSFRWAISCAIQNSCFSSISSFRFSDRKMNPFLCSNSSMKRVKAQYSSLEEMKKTKFATHSTISFGNLDNALARMTRNSSLTLFIPPKA